MAIVVRKLRSGKSVYWLSFEHQGKAVWERVGTNKREAERLHDQRKAERKAGTYRVARVTAFVTVKDWFARYLDGRTNRAADGERQMMRAHVLTLEWFTAMRVTHVEPLDIERVVKEIRASGKLGEKSIANAYAVIRGSFRRAVFEQVIPVSPCMLMPGTVKKGTGKRRHPYTRAEARQLMACAENPPGIRVFLHLAFYTGMREGEIVGRRWADWRRDGGPLTALVVDSQYDDLPLKGDDGVTERPRVVPVHPELEAILASWWDVGFELTHLRPPTIDDFIVPTSGLVCHSRSSAYRAFRRALARAEVVNRSLHSTRHTFVSVSRSSGAREDAIERITHNAKGTTLDAYTALEWEVLCEAIAKGPDYSLDRETNRAFFSGSDSRTRTTGGDANAAPNRSNAQESGGEHEGSKTPSNTAPGAELGANQDPDDVAFFVALAEHPGSYPPARPPAKTRPAGYVARKRGARG